MPETVPEESEGERFTRGMRNRFYTFDSWNDFQMNRLGGLRRGQTRQWNTTRFQMKREMNKLKDDYKRFVDQDMQQIFQTGMRHGSGNQAYTLSAADKASLRRQRAKARTAFEAADRNARRRTNMSWRQAREYAHSDPTIPALTRPRHKTRLLAVEYRGKGIRPGQVRQVPYGVHQAMVIRTQAQISYNLGTIRGGESAKVEAFEIVDGPGCGMSSHDDSEQANGQIVSAYDAKRYLLAHPNCTRTFIPRPDLPKPPPRGSAAYRAWQKLHGSVATNLQSPIVQAQIQNILLDMALDAEMRRFVFSTGRRAIQSLAEMQARIDAYLRHGNLGGPHDFDEALLLDDAVDQIDEYLETGDVNAISEWLRYILMADKKVTIPDLNKAAGDLDYYREITIRADMTHRELNILNSIEETYGEFVIRRMASMFPESDDLSNAYMGFLRRYAPGTVSGQDPTTLGHRVGNRILSRGLGKVQDQTTNRLASAINASGIVGDGSVSFPRLGRYLDRPDLLGLRYTWGNRLLKAESTVVNRFRSMSKQQLVNQMVIRNGSPREIVQYLRGEANIFDNILRDRTRQELIRALGYRPGILAHFTINPQGLVRLGFRFDPAHGWRRPIPIVRVVSRSTPLRYEARLNRGRLFGADKAAGVEGVRIRSISQEISIATGGSLNFNQVAGTNLPAALNPGVARIGIRFKTTLNAINENMAFLDTAGDIGLILRNTTFKQLMQQTEFMSAFVELRALGWSWFRIGKVFSLNAEEVALLAQTTRQFFGGNYLAQYRSLTYMEEAQRIIATGGNPDDAMTYLQKALAEAAERGDDLVITREGIKFKLGFSPTKRNQFLLKIYEDSQDLYDELVKLYGIDPRGPGSGGSARFVKGTSSASPMGFSLDDLMKQTSALKEARIANRKLLGQSSGIRTDTFQSTIGRTVDLSGLDDDLRNIVIEQWNELEELYPDIARRITRIGGPESQEFLGNDPSDWLGLTESPTFWFGDAAPQYGGRVGFTNFTDEDLALFGPKFFTVPTKHGVVVHEFGHVVQDFVDDVWRAINNRSVHAPFPSTHPDWYRGQDIPILDIILDAHEELLEAQGKMDIIRQQVEEHFQNTGVPVAEGMEASLQMELLDELNGISTYATTNWAEAFAEMWTDVYFRGTSANPLSRAVVRKALEYLDIYRGRVTDTDFMYFIDPLDI